MIARGGQDRREALLTWREHSKSIASRARPASFARESRSPRLGACAVSPTARGRGTMATTVGERSIVSSHARKDAAPATAEERCQPSYVSGASTRPLLGESIGAIFDRTIERFGDREALVSRHQGLRYSYAELAAAVEEVARGLLAHGPRAGRAGRDLGAQLRRVDARAVRHRQAGDHSRQHQSGVPDVGARVRAAPVRLPGAGRREGVQDLRLRCDGRRGPPEGAQLWSRWSSSTAPTGTRC